MKAKSQHIKSFFVDHFVLKLMALILATMTVYAIQRITSQTEEFEVPIVINVDDGIAILKQDAKTAYITCSGSLDDLRRLNVKELKIIVNSKTTGIYGSERFPIGPRNVSVWTRGVKITKIRPGIVDVDFDREIEKQLAVAKPETVGKPLLGKVEVTYEPKLVTIKGPKSKLIDQKILSTAPINVEGISASFDTKLQILTEGQSSVCHIEPQEVTAHVNIVTEAISKEWKDIKVMALIDSKSGKTVKFSPETVDVSLRGSPQTVNSISNEEISIFVDCITITKPGSYKIPASIHIPTGINISAAISPPIINVTVENQKPDKKPENSETMDLEPNSAKPIKHEKKTES